MSRPTVFYLVLLKLVALACAAEAQVVINEINYRPGTGYPEDTRLEFIELHNPTAASVDVSGWAITSGTSFIIPAGTIIPGGGYFVIAADPAAVASTYGIVGVAGPWQAGSTLANGGEKIALSKPAAVAGTFDEVDAVSYANEGDWATRVRETVFGGWDWSTPANGGNNRSNSAIR
jgi:hypothetical protein